MRPACPIGWASLIAGLALGAAAAMAAPAPAPTAPTPTAPVPAPTTTAPTTTAPVPAAPSGPPLLSGLEVPRTVGGQQGHAKLLVGVRTTTAATFTLRIVDAASKVLVKMTTTSSLHPPGRAFLLFDATSQQGYEMPDGTYELTITGTDARGRRSAALKAVFRVKLKPAHGRLDAYTVPLWPAFARQLRARPGGHLVTAVAPGGAAVAAGLRRGDVITAIGGRPVLTPGQLATALRDLPAGGAVPIDFIRPGSANAPPLSIRYLIAPPADYTAPPRYAASFAVILKRTAGLLAYSYAAAKDLVEEGKPDAARDMVNSWPLAWRRSAPGQLVMGDILVAQGETKGALGAYTRAAKADPSLSVPQVQRGLALATLGNIPAAGGAFAAAVRADPHDAVALGYRAYLLAATGSAAAALDLANRTIARQPNYEYGHLARGLALIALGRQQDGVTALKRGLLLSSDHTRAGQIITQYLEPNDP
jgi:hypothetical protein